MKIFAIFNRKKNYCRQCKKTFKNRRGYMQHYFKMHTNGISDEGVV